MKRSRKGFTLAELLIVVAIIAVLVAIAIPIFINQLEKARESTDAANIRDYYAEIATALVTGDLDATNHDLKLSGGKTAVYGSYVAPTDSADGSFKVEVGSITVNQTLSNWQTGKFTVAGYEIVDTDDMVNTNTIVYTFTVPKAGNAYLSKISFS